MCAKMNFTPKHFVMLFTVFAVNGAKATSGLSNGTENSLGKRRVSLGETIVVRVNISGHQQADFFEVTGDTYPDKIKKISTENWQQSPNKDNWRHKFVSLAYVGDGIVDVEIRVENKSMAGIYQIYEYCKGAMKICSSNPLMKFMLVIEEGIPPNRTFYVPQILTEAPQIKVTKQTKNQGSSMTPDTSPHTSTDVIKKTKSQGSSYPTGITALSNLLLPLLLPLMLVV